MNCHHCGAPADPRRDNCRYCGVDLTLDVSRYVRTALTKLNDEPYVSTGPAANFIPIVRGRGVMVIV